MSTNPKKGQLSGILGEGKYLALRFTSADANGKLHAFNHFQGETSKFNEVICTRYGIGNWCKSLRAFCIALLRAKYIGMKQKIFTDQIFEIGTTTDRESWVPVLANVLEHEAGWVASFFTSKENAKRIVFVTGGRESSGRGTEKVLPIPATAHYRCSNLPLDRLFFLVGTSPDPNDWLILNDPEQFIRFAEEIGTQHPPIQVEHIDVGLAKTSLKPLSSVNDEMPKAGPLKNDLAVGHGLNTPNYWLDLAIDTVFGFSNQEHRRAVIMYLASVAVALGRSADANRLIADFTNHVLQLPNSADQQADNLFKIAQWYASAGDILTARRIALRLQEMSADNVEQIGIWSKASEGVFGALIENLAAGCVYRGETTEGKKYLSQLKEYSKRRALKGPPTDRWKTSEAFVELMLKTGDVQKAIEHFQWMCKEGYQPDAEYGVWLRIVHSLIRSEKWQEAKDFTENCEVLFDLPSDKASVWINFLDAFPFSEESSHSRPERKIFDYIFSLIGKQSSAAKRASLYAKIAKLSAQHGIDELYNQAIGKAVRLLEKTLNNEFIREKEHREEKKQVELKIRLKLYEAHHKAGVQKTRDSELAAALKIGQDLLRNGRSDHVPDIAGALIECGNKELAIEWALLWTVPLVGSGVLDSLANEGDYEPMRHIYNQMLSPVDKLSFFMELFGAFESNKILSICS